MTEVGERPGSDLQEEPMSCWVVPTVAAEYWGISVDLVLRRMSEGLLPQMSQSGFVFVDIDPWTAACSGGYRHEPPPTFVSTPQVMGCTHSTWAPASAPADAAEDELLLEESDQTQEEQADDELPDLDEEESATFGRLSWEEVRQQVSRTRRPPPSFRN